MAEDRQRIDKWLWFARVVKTRPLAQALAEGGKVRVNGRKVDTAHHPVRRGDVLTIGVGSRVLVLEIVDFAERRGSYPDAVKLYIDRAPREMPPDAGEEPAGSAPPVEEAPAPPSGRPTVHRGEGRPSKRDRRRFDRIGGAGED
ncbi:RNA-binding S4 domain-containing protein [Chthonobacter albigriseus]|uniref:RNA-binding S4 domain-containing protein n=1 Tax=Chthonobacter albigriseus TaxID=1683161 RepID=UPI003140B794